MFLYEYKVHGIRDTTMGAKDVLKGKKLLIVDDEIDVLDSLLEILDVCKLDTADTFDKAKKLIETQYYDLVILDIMGVNGFDLLKIANDYKIPALMVTAIALSEEALKKSAKEGAVYFVPKDHMADMDVYVADVFKALRGNQNPWDRWFGKLSGFFDRRFHGTSWREDEKEFWEKLRNTPF